LYGGVRCHRECNARSNLASVAHRPTADIDFRPSRFPLTGRKDPTGSGKSAGPPVETFGDGSLCALSSGFEDQRCDYIGL
jgi:hypothetical protein